MTALGPKAEECTGRGRDGTGAEGQAEGPHGSQLRVGRSRMLRREPICGWAAEALLQARVFWEPLENVSA